MQSNGLAGIKQSGESCSASAPRPGKSNAKRVVMSRRKVPYGFTCPQVSGVVRTPADQVGLTGLDRQWKAVCGRRQRSATKSCRICSLPAGDQLAFDPILGPAADVVDGGNEEVGEAVRDLVLTDKAEGRRARRAGAVLPGFVAWFRCRFRSQWSTVATGTFSGRRGKRSSAWNSLGSTAKPSRVAPLLLPSSTRLAACNAQRRSTSSRTGAFSSPNAGNVRGSRAAVPRFPWLRRTCGRRGRFCGQSSSRHSAPRDSRLASASSQAFSRMCRVKGISVGCNSGSNRPRCFSIVSTARRACSSGA